MKERVILHCDLNNFYASVECLENPALSSGPLAICGSREDRHGVVLAKNEAAKQFGVRTGEAVWEAQRKCPGLTIAPPHHDRYEHYSRLARAIYERFTDQIEPYGIDECWLDVTGSTGLFGTGREIADRLRALMKEELGLTISVGVSFNKVFAKLGSDLKKPDGTTVITREDFRQQVWPLPAGALLGVGNATRQALARVGICTIGEVAQAGERTLTSLLGKHGTMLWRAAAGLDDEPVAHMNDRPPVKSVGHAVTCTRDLHRREEVWPVLLSLSEQVARRLREQGLAATSVAVTIKDNRLVSQDCQGALDAPSCLTGELAQKAMALFDARWHYERGIRMLGVRAQGLCGAQEARQLSLFGDRQRAERLEALERQVDTLCGRFGRAGVTRASLMERDALPQQEGPRQTFIHRGPDDAKETENPQKSSKK